MLLMKWSVLMNKSHFQQLECLWMFLSTITRSSNNDLWWYGLRLCSLQLPVSNGVLWSVNRSSLHQLHWVMQLTAFEILALKLVEAQSIICNDQSWWNLQESISQLTELINILEISFFPYLPSGAMKMRNHWMSCCFKDVLKSTLLLHFIITRLVYFSRHSCLNYKPPSCELWATQIVMWG